MWELITWTATGLGIGWLARTVMRSTRDFGLIGDLTTGWLGGVVGGWLFRRLNITAPDDAIGHVVADARRRMAQTMAVIGAAFPIVELAGCFGVISCPLMQPARPWRTDLCPNR